ncbi:MAG: hypothetical protein GY855_13285, partial [candidate division Zixibacteria bacterium]|nr:hypothetical protein [candidate division Zixibacteria bacterium]
PEQILKPGDVKHFIKTFPLLEKEMKNLGIEYETKGGTITAPEAVKSRNELTEILKKHGWDDSFFQKTGVILLGYSSILYSEEKKKAESGFQESLNEIDSNPHLSDEMKKQLKEQMKAAESAMNIQGTTFTNSIHPHDLQMISPHIEEIQRVLDKENESISSRNSSPTNNYYSQANEPSSSDLTARINLLLKKELEKEFGPLTGELSYDRQEIYGRVLSFNYGLKQGNLDESWGKNVETAMGRLGITVKVKRSEVRAKDQEIENIKFASLQFTTSRGLDEPDLISATFLIPNK